MNWVTIIQGGKDNIGNEVRKQAKKPWVTEEMLKIMDEKRRWKNIGTEEGRCRGGCVNDVMRLKSWKERDRLISCIRK